MVKQQTERKMPNVFSRECWKRFVTYKSFGNGREYSPARRLGFRERYYYENDW